MRWIFLCVTGAILIAGGKAFCAEHPAVSNADVPLSGTPFKVGGLKFTIPYKWQSIPVENSNRAGQWHVPLPHGLDGEGGDVVVFFFGPGVGGSPKDNIDAWNDSMTTPDGQRPAADVKNHAVNGIKITRVTIFGTYLQTVSIPEIPPETKPDYGMLCAVVENPQGNIYWRFTGPEALIKANQPLFDKIVDSVKPQDK